MTRRPTHLNQGERIGVFDAEQFIALNLYELGKFKATAWRVAVGDVVTRYILEGNATVTPF